MLMCILCAEGMDLHLCFGFAHMGSQLYVAAMPFVSYYFLSPLYASWN